MKHAGRQNGIGLAQYDAINEMLQTTDASTCNDWYLQGLRKCTC